MEKFEITLSIDFSIETPNGEEFAIEEAKSRLIEGIHCGTIGKTDFKVEAWSNS